jgi:hypothetical protein
MSADGNRRLTLCGLLAYPSTRPFYDQEPTACRTCVAIDALRPSARPIRPSQDLAALRAMLDEAAVEVSRALRAARAGRSNHPLQPPEAILGRLLGAA